MEQKQGSVGVAVATAHDSAGSEHPANTASIPAKKESAYRKGKKPVVPLELFNKLLDLLRYEQFNGCSIAELSSRCGFGPSTLSQWKSSGFPPRHGYLALKGLRNNDSGNTPIEAPVEIVNAFNPEELKNIAKNAMEQNDFELAKKSPRPDVENICRLYFKGVMYTSRFLCPLMDLATGGDKNDQNSERYATL